MTINTRSLLATLAASAALGLGLAATPAGAVINLNPGNADGTTNDNSNCEPGCIPTGTALTLQYKAQPGEEGPFAGSYEVNPFGTTGFTINYTGGPTISCPECWLVAKDGAHIPAQYFWDLGSWDGMEQIVVSGLWPDGGSLSHVSIWSGSGSGGGSGGSGGGSGAPEPASVSLLALMGLGLVGASLRARRRKS